MVDSPNSIRGRRMSEGVKGRAWNGNRADFDLNLTVIIGINHYINPSIQKLS